jgi:hypothetical protein
VLSEPVIITDSSLSVIFLYIIIEKLYKLEEDRRNLMTEHRERPPHIVTAIEKGDTEHLRRCGRNGALVTNKIKAAKKLAVEKAKQKKVDDWWKFFALPANFHVIDPDGEDQNFCGDLA